MAGTLRVLLLTCVVGISLVAVPALAKEHKEKPQKSVPDVTGVWKGVSQGVVVGWFGQVPPTDEPRFQHFDWTLAIDKQEGLAFSGVKTSEKGRETVVGTVQGTKLSLADDTGVFFGRLTGKNTMILNYLEFGKNSKTASIIHLRREQAAGAQAGSAPKP